MYYVSQEIPAQAHGGAGGGGAAGERRFMAAGGWKQSKVSFRGAGEVKCGGSNVEWGAVAGNNHQDVNSDHE